MNIFLKEYDRLKEIIPQPAYCLSKGIKNIRHILTNTNEPTQKLIGISDHCTWEKRHRKGKSKSVPSQIQWEPLQFPQKDIELTPIW